MYGISAQGRESHRKFAEKNNLGFPLLVDADGKITRAYRMVQEISDEDRERLRAAGYDVGDILSKRGTFIIDPQGDIRHIDLQVSVRTHGADLAKRLAELQGK